MHTPSAGRLFCIAMFIGAFAPLAQASLQVPNPISIEYGQRVGDNVDITPMLDLELGNVWGFVYPTQWIVDGRQVGIGTYIGIDPFWFAYGTMHDEVSLGLLPPGHYTVNWGLWVASSLDPLGGQPVTPPTESWTKSFLVTREGAYPGDFNADGVINTQDINPFVLALTNPAGYAATYPHVDPLLVDPNQDGTINTEDINPWIQYLTGGGSSLGVITIRDINAFGTILTGGPGSAVIPEPASLVMLVPGGLAIMRRHRR